MRARQWANGDREPNMQHHIEQRVMPWVRRTLQSSHHTGYRMLIPAVSGSSKGVSLFAYRQWGWVPAAIAALKQVYGQNYAVTFVGRTGEGIIRNDPPLPLSVENPEASARQFVSKYGSDIYFEVLLRPLN